MNKRGSARMNKEKYDLTMGKRICRVMIFLSVLMVGNILNEKYWQSVNAANQSVQYTYDRLGRVISATYSDGTVFYYEYDKNGNIEAIHKKEPVIPEQPETSEPSEIPDQSDKPNSPEQPETPVQPEQSDTSEQPEHTHLSELPVEEKMGYHAMNATISLSIESVLHNTPEEVKEYNQFKKKKPVVKSLKIVKKNKKRYLKIQIKQVKKRGIYGETGYQVKYATNSKFKKAKAIDVTRKKKGSLTSKQWKATKNKTYYVKVRAYLTTRLGKKIYTKYSKVKQIKIAE